MYFFQFNNKKRSGVVLPWYNRLWQGWRPGKAGFVLSLLFLVLYSLVFQRRVLCDITAQVQTILRVCACEVDMPPTALFYVLSWLGALGQCRFVPLMAGATIALVLLVSFRFWVTRAILEDYFAEKDTKKEYFGFLAFTLALVTSIPTADWWERGWYLFGQPSPNYWMNGTLLASWPWALILFWESYRQLQSPDARWWKRELLWLFLLLVSKPSYALVFGLVYPAFLIGRYGFSAVVRWHLLPVLLSAAGLCWEYFAVFLWPDSVYVKQFNAGEASGVLFSWATVWRLHTGSIFWSVLGALFFPLLVAVLYWRVLYRRLLFWYVWAGMLVALGISAAFMQAGAEYYTWAFRFQQYIAAYILFLVSLLWVWEQVRLFGWRWKSRETLALGVFGLHLLAGLGYWVHWWWSRGHQ